MVTTNTSPSPDPELGVTNVRLERLVWDERVMAFVVRLSPLEPHGAQFTSVNPTAHITVGTAAPNVKPVEANAMLARWMQQGTGPSGISELAVKGHVELEGTVKGVLQKF
jgi:tRNA ligase